ncbi:MAG: type II toxin-antitoxin system HicA family toxin [Deltaproteobacteria bacterium]|jgi:predicted RNA binding protein YcfA (HicA-like mRNA interferase family)|nr:type II toxin-antitoxin system HicA family toxin [Deltaproteobacteria bacterium]
MAEYEKIVRKILSENGYAFLRRSKGDHDIWPSPINNHNLTVDTKIPSHHMANAIMKQCGIKHHF